MNPLNGCTLGICMFRTKNQPLFQYLMAFFSEHRTQILLNPSSMSIDSIKYFCMITVKILNAKTLYVFPANVLASQFAMLSIRVYNVLYLHILLHYRHTEVW